MGGREKGGDRKRGEGEGGGEGEDSPTGDAIKVAKFPR